MLYLTRVRVELVKMPYLFQQMDCISKKRKKLWTRNNLKMQIKTGCFKLAIFCIYKIILLLFKRVFAWDSFGSRVYVFGIQ